MKKAFLCLALAALMALPDAAFALTYNETVFTKTYASANFGFGRTDMNGSKRAMEWTANLNTYVCAVKFWAGGLQGSPTDSVTVRLLSGGTGPHNASLMASTAYSYALWTNGQKTWNLPVCYSVGRAQKLWLTFERSGTLDDSKYFYVGYDSSAAGNATSSVWSYTGSWADANKQPYLVLIGTQAASSTLPITLEQMRNSPTSTSVTKQCPDFGLFTPFCEAAAYLLYPDLNTVLAKSTELVTTAQNVVPFTYLFMKTRADGAATGTNIGEIRIPKDMINGSSTFQVVNADLVIFSSSTVTKYMGTGNVNLLRNIVSVATYGMIISFLMWKFKEIL